MSTRVGREHPCTVRFVSEHPAWVDEEVRVTFPPLDPECGRIISHHITACAGGTAMATALEREHVSGSTEPWVQDLIMALLDALQLKHPVVMEFGGFLGHTSVRFLRHLGAVTGGGDLTIVEYDPEAPQRADAVHAALAAQGFPHVTWRVRREDALAVIPTLADESVDFVFLDDNHAKQHVDKEITLLWPKMRTCGLIVGHDVFGSCDLQEIFHKYGGYALDLPRLGPAGGLGILQVR